MSQANSIFSPQNNTPAWAVRDEKSMLPLSISATPIEIESGFI
jgi:hypothetical protein